MQEFYAKCKEIEEQKQKDQADYEAKLAEMEERGEETAEFIQER